MDHPWYRVSITGSTLPNLPDCARTILEGGIQAGLKDVENREGIQILHDPGKNLYFFSPKAAEALGQSWLDTYSVGACEKPDWNALQEMEL